MSRRQKISLFLLIVIGVLYMGLGCVTDGSRQDSVYMGTGIKIGEVTSNSAIIWTRLTQVEEPDTAGIKFLDFNEKEFLHSFEEIFVNQDYFFKAHTDIPILLPQSIIKGFSECALKK